MNATIYLVQGGVFIAGDPKAIACYLRGRLVLYRLPWHGLCFILKTKSMRMVLLLQRIRCKYVTTVV